MPKSGGQRRRGSATNELALFDLLFRESIGQADRERLKHASRALLASLRDLLRPMHGWTQNTVTQAEVQVAAESLVLPCGSAQNDRPC
jgi:hypothetical protein